MISKLVQRTRRNRYISMTRENPQNVIYIHLDGNRKSVVIGNHVLFMDNMELVPMTDIEIPATHKVAVIENTQDHLMRPARDKLALIKYLDQFNYPYSYCVPLVEHDGYKWGVTRKSLSPCGLWVSMWNDNGQVINIPIVAWGQLVHHSKAHQYVTKGYLLNEGERARENCHSLSTLITTQLLNDVHGAITKSVEVDGCPGMAIPEAHTLRIDVSRLDNSSEPVVDLSVFLDIYHESIDHLTPYIVNLDKIEIKYGLNPGYTSVREILTTHPRPMRLIMSDTLSQHAHAEYNTNGVDIPVGFP